MARHRKVIPLEQAQQRFEERQRRMSASAPKTFAGTMRQILQRDRGELNRMVYGTPKPTKRSALLKNSEKLEFQGKWAAVIKNTASSVWRGVKTYYGWCVAKGIKARNKGNKYYAWMTDPRAARPNTWEEWVNARAAGLAVLAHRLGKVPGKDWRKKALQDARKAGLMAKLWRQANEEDSK